MAHIIPDSAYEMVLNEGCPEGYTRDLWFYIPEGNVTSAPCDLRVIVFYAFLIIFCTVYGVLILLSFLAAAFTRQRNARMHLILNTFHSTAGFCLCVGPLARGDVYSVGNPAFWICFSVFIAGILAHSLLMTEAIKRLSLSVAPHHIATGPLFERFMESSVAQRCALWFAGLQVVALFASFILVGYTQSPPETPAIYWTQDPNFLDRREFWFFVGCLLGEAAALTFIVIPLRLHIKLHYYVKETRLKAEIMLNLPMSKQSRTSLADSKRLLPVVQDFPDEEAKEQPPGSPLSVSRRGSKDSMTSNDEEEATSPRPRRPSRIEQGIHSLTRASSEILDNVVEGLKDGIKLPPPKRKQTLSELQRKQMQEFEVKMLHAFVVGVLGCVAAILLFTLICDQRIMGAKCYLMFPVLAVGWFLEFSILNLYFPEQVLHKLFVSHLPKWAQEQIDGVEF